MATNIITPSNSLNGQLADVDVGAVLLVTEGGYILNNAINQPAYAALGGSGNITIKGSIVSALSYGIYLLSAANDATLVGNNTVTISSSGILNGTIGAWLEGEDNRIDNEGLIVSSASSDRAIRFTGGYNNVDNGGTIKGYYGIDAASNVSVTNSGTISSAFRSISCGSYANVTNSGSIFGDIIVAESGIIENSGSITGRLFLSRSIDSGSSVHNSGTITGRIQTSEVAFYIQTDTVINDGRLGAIELGKGNDSIENHLGATIAGIVHLDDAFGGAGADNDSLINGGTIIGNVFGGDGDDVVDTATGVIIGLVDLGAGNDAYTGGDATDRVIGGAGADTITLGAGDDQYRAINADGKDDLDGGDGRDTYNASACTLSVGVDLSAATSSLTVGNDLILNFENIIGGSANDTLTGSDDGNRIDGGAGADILSGGEGNDRILGGAGTDTITGGLGRDVLTGGTATGLNEADKFVFSDGDSGTKAATRDVITDFTDHGSAAAPFATGADTIDLHLIDANTVAGGNQAFSFNSVSGAAFSGTAGSLIWLQTNQFALVLGDTDGDGKADFTIQLNGVHALLASDFVL